jgi:hypothetical protein
MYASLVIHVIMLLAIAVISPVLSFPTIGLNSRLNRLQPRPSNLVLESQTTLDDVNLVKMEILQLGAALDRGQAYNPTSGEYYAGTMAKAREKVEEVSKKMLLTPSSANSLARRSQLVDFQNIPTSLNELEGEWELGKNEQEVKELASRTSTHYINLLETHFARHATLIH